MSTVAQISKFPITSDYLEIPKNKFFDLRLYNCAMQNNPELQGNNSDEFRKFIERLDGPPDDRILLPGYLFRDRTDHRYGPRVLWGNFIPGGIPQRMAAANSRLADIDWDLLKIHEETYNRALEARRQLLDRIKPDEILEGVKVEWGLGEVKTGVRGIYLDCTYPRTEIQTSGGRYYERRYDPINGNPLIEHISGGPTGKWIAVPAGRHLSITVDFKEGSDDCYAEYPSLDAYKAEFPTAGMSEQIIHQLWFFDLLRHTTSKGFRGGDWDDRNYELFRGIPKRIAITPDTLSILIDGAYKNNFGPSVSKEEILDFLEPCIQQERIDGHLPYQIAALETSKIAELKKRGLFVE